MACGRFPPVQGRFPRRAGPPTATVLCSPGSKSEDQRIYSVSLRSGRIRLLNDEPEGLDNTDSTLHGHP